MDRERQGRRGRASFGDDPEVRLREEAPVGPEGTLYVDLDLGSITVQVHERACVEIDARANGTLAELVSFALDREDGDVYLDGELSDVPRRWHGQTRVRVRAQVPQDYAVDLRTRAGRIHVLGVSGRIAAETAAGPVRVRDVRGPALLRTAAGSIRIDGVERDLRAFTLGGPISVRGASGNLELRTSAGPIRVRRARGRVDARTHAGPIVASFRCDPTGSLRTIAGPIDVAFPPHACAELDARVGAGHIHIDSAFALDVPRRASRIRAALGPGGAPLVLRSTLGTIRVHPLDDNGPEPRPHEPAPAPSEPPRPRA